MRHPRTRWKARRANTPSTASGESGTASTTTAAAAPAAPRLRVSRPTPTGTGPGRRDGTAARLVRVLVADDDALVRSALSMVLDAAAGVLLVGEVADGDEVPAAVATFAPDVVLMDIRMSRVDGLTATHPADIVAAVHRVVEGEAMLSPAITRRLIDLVTAEPAAPTTTTGRRKHDLLARLTGRRSRRGP